MNEGKSTFGIVKQKKTSLHVKLYNLQPKNVMNIFKKTPSSEDLNKLLLCKDNL